MQTDINLLPRKNQGFLQKEQTILAVRIVAIFSVIIVASFGIGVLLLGRNYSIENVQNQQASMHSRLQLFQHTASQELSLIDRTNKIAQILKTRTSLISNISTIQQQIPEGLTMQSLDVDATTVSLSVTSTSLATLQSFLDGLTRLVNKKVLFQRLTMNGVSVDAKTGVYSVTVVGIMK